VKIFQIGLLAGGSTSQPRLPIGKSQQWRERGCLSPLTATGSRRISTGFPTSEKFLYTLFQRTIYELNLFFVRGMSIDIFRLEKLGNMLNIIRPFDDSFLPYLFDESRMMGNADAIALPENEGDVLEVLAEARLGKTPVTISAGRTGLTGGASPDGGILLSFERMNRIFEKGFDAQKKEWFIRIEPGVRLEDIARALSGEPRLFYPPDPTEQTAMLGGAVACNASGARTFDYGATRSYVRRLRVALITGEILDIRRGDIKADSQNMITIPLPHRSISFSIPAYQMPGTKNTAGYFTEPKMDLIDLFIGSEGTLGVFTEMELRLLSKPPFTIGVMIYFPSDEAVARFVHNIRKSSLHLHPQSLEYFDQNSLELLRQKRLQDGASNKIAAIPESARAILYYERLYDDEGMTEQILGSLEEALGAHGISLEDTWAAFDEEGIQRMKDFRHALPEAVNALIAQVKTACPNITKLGTDFAVPDQYLDEMMKLYRVRLNESQLRHVIFGHIGDNHLHINIIPRDEDEYEAGKRLYLELADEVIRRGGTIAAEHGIGKLKKHLLHRMLGEHGIEEMRRIKRLFDPDFLINRGNLF